jgi:hypothetical protein
MLESRPLPVRMSSMSRFVSLALIAVVLAIIAFAFTLLPRGYDTDVSKVGQGRPAAVLVHDHGLVQSMELMSALDAVRGEFESSTLFIVADTYHPRGQAFVEAHRLPPVALVMFDGDGDLLGRHTGNTDAESIRRFLAEFQSR